MPDSISVNTLLPFRLNAEPPVFRGSTLTELTWLVMAGFVIWLPVLLILSYAIFSTAMPGFGLTIFAMLGSVLAGGKWLQRAKRGRPLGYYQLQVQFLLHRLGVRRSPFIQESGVWDVGRSVVRQ